MVPIRRHKCLLLTQTIDIYLVYCILLLNLFRLIAAARLNWCHDIQGPSVLTVIDRANLSNKPPFGIESPGASIP